MRRPKTPPGETPAASPSPLPGPPSPALGPFSRAIRQTLAGDRSEAERQSALALAHKADPAAGPRAKLLAEILLLRPAQDVPDSRTLPPASALPLLF